MTERKKSIVLLDLWTDANRGDCALQLGLIGMVRERWPQARVFGVFRFGTNEMSTALAEAGITAAALDGHCGGLRRTYYSAANLNRHGPLAAKLVSLFSFIEAFFWLCLYKLRLPGVPRAKKQVMDELAHADVVIWKGKNFRDYGGLGGINRQMTLLSAGMLGTSLNRNVHCVNASVWEMRYRVERWLVQRTIAKCRSLTVREP